MLPIDSTTHTHWLCFKWTIIKYTQLTFKRNWNSGVCLTIYIYTARSFFVFLLHSGCHCHPQFVGLNRNGAGSQVLGVGDKKESFLYGGILYNFQLPIFKQCMFVKEMLLENTFILLAHFGIACCQSWTIWLLSDFLCFFISLIETGDKTQPEDRQTRVWCKYSVLEWQLWSTDVQLVC